MNNLTPEIIEKAKAVGSVDELLTLAKENGIELTEDEAKTYFAQLNPKGGELDDNDLDSVAGGACASTEPDPLHVVGTKVRVINGTVCKKCGGTDGTMEVSSYWYVACGACSKGLNQVIIWQPELGVDVELI